MSVTGQTTATPGRGQPAARLWQLAWISGRPVLQLGRRWLALDEVRGFSVQKIAERDNEGLLFNFALFGLLACAFVVPVLQNVMAVKFLIAAGLLGAIALMSLSEVLLSKKVVHFRLDFQMHDGQTVSFVSPFAADVDAVAHVLTQVAAGPRALAAM